jgi:hypothetical protein
MFSEMNAEEPVTRDLILQDETGFLDCAWACLLSDYDDVDADKLFDDETLSEYAESFRDAASDYKARLEEYNAREEEELKQDEYLSFKADALDGETRKTGYNSKGEESKEDEYESFKNDKLDVETKNVEHDKSEENSKKNKYQRPKEKELVVTQPEKKVHNKINGKELKYGKMTEEELKKRMLRVASLKRPKYDSLDIRAKFTGYNTSENELKKSTLLKASLRRTTELIEYSRKLAATKISSDNERAFDNVMESGSKCRDQKPEHRECELQHGSDKKSSRTGPPEMIFIGREDVPGSIDMAGTKASAERNLSTVVSQRGAEFENYQKGNVHGEKRKDAPGSAYIGGTKVSTEKRLSTTESPVETDYKNYLKSYVYAEKGKIDAPGSTDVVGANVGAVKNSLTTVSPRGAAFENYLKTHVYTETDSSEQKYQDNKKVEDVEAIKRRELIRRIALLRIRANNANVAKFDS